MCCTVIGPYTSARLASPLEALNRLWGCPNNAAAANVRSAAYNDHARGQSRSVVCTLLNTSFNMSAARTSLEKPDFDVEHREHGQDGSAPQLYTEDEEPELHLKTWLALAAMCVLQYVSLLALVGPPTVVGNFEHCPVAMDWYNS